MPQSLCHGMSEMPSVTPMGLNSASMRFCARRLRPNSCPASGISRAPRSGRRRAGRARWATRDRTPACARVARSPSAVRAHHDRPSSGAYVGTASSMSDDTAAISSSSKTPERCMKPGFLEEVAHLVRVVAGSEPPREVERRAVAVGERDRSRRVDRRAVQCGPPHEPPVQEVADVALRLFEPVRGPHAHERLLVVHEVVELLRGRVVRGRRRRTAGPLAIVTRPSVTRSVHTLPSTSTVNGRGATNSSAGTMQSAWASIAAGSSDPKKASGSRRGRSSSSRMRTSTRAMTAGYAVAPIRSDDASLTGTTASGGGIGPPGVAGLARARLAGGREGRRLPEGRRRPRSRESSRSSAFASR